MFPTKPIWNPGNVEILDRWILSFSDTEILLHFWTMFAVLAWSAKQFSESCFHSARIVLGLYIFLRSFVGVLFYCFLIFAIFLQYGSTDCLSATTKESFFYLPFVSFQCKKDNNIVVEWFIIENGAQTERNRPSCREESRNILLATRNCFKCMKSVSETDLAHRISL